MIAPLLFKKIRLSRSSTNQVSDPELGILNIDARTVLTQAEADISSQDSIHGVLIWSQLSVS